MTFPKPQMVTWQIVSGLGQAHSFRGGSSYPFPFNYFVNVIEVFIGRLRKKMDPDNTIKPIETLRGRGYRFALERNQSD